MVGDNWSMTWRAPGNWVSYGLGRSGARRASGGSGPTRPHHRVPDGTARPG
jgi:hypothetical protein